MPDQVTYYAIVDELSSRDDPAGVFRRTVFPDGGMADEAFGRNLAWSSSWLLASAERGDLTNEFVEISEEEADRIVERIRQKMQAANNPGA